MKKQLGTIYRCITQRNYVSTLEHILRDLGDEKFIDLLISEIPLDELFNQGEYEKMYYTIGLVEYINCDTDKKNIYIKDFAKGKLEKLTYSEGVEIYCSVVNNNNIKEKQLSEALPEFLKYNLVVTKVGDIV